MSIFRTLRALRLRTPAKPAHFELRYEPGQDESVTVGFLDFDGSVWTFRYDDEYRRMTHLRPLEGFDDLLKTYQSTTLFPFFAVRIPDVERADVQRRLQTESVKDPDPAELLRLFGRRVVSSPAFELVAH